MGIKPFKGRGMSWSAMRKVLEQENICDSLKGRIQYFQTRYRKTHDHTSRVAIRLDGKEIFQTDFFRYYNKVYEIHRERMESDKKIGYGESYDQAFQVATEQVGMYSFFDAFHIYRNSNIGESIVSPNPYVRLFAILDKRIGKRRLKNLLPEIEKQPEWLQVFYRLRFEVEGVDKNDRQST